MKKYITLILISAGIGLFGQIGLSEAAGIKNLRIGGNISADFGDNGYFGMNISPTIGYKVAPNLEVGAGLGYQFNSTNVSKMNLFSLGPYLNYYPISNMFLRANFEFYTGNHEFKNSGLPKVSVDESALWLGGGYATGGPISFHAGVMYNVLFKDGKSIFSNGFRPYAGVSIGL